MADDDERTARHAQLCEYHQRGRELLQAQTRAIDALIHDLHSLGAAGDDVAIRVALLMLQAVGVSAHSVLALTVERDMAIRDCFGITRSAVETAVNATFIAVSGTPMAEKALRHMRQKRWRDLRRQGTVGEHRITVSRAVGLEVDDMPGLREALDEYTNKRGDEVRDWTTENLEKRISVISDRHQRAGLCLGVASFSIYRPASELLHGTYYGVNLFWQGSRDAPVRTRHEFDEVWVTEHFVTLLTALFFAVSGAIDVIAAVHTLAGHSERQDELSQRLSSLVEAMSGDEPDGEQDFRADGPNEMT
ncbi:MAG: hypothetical protein QOG72_1509 [Sphingomonadales bacterium]|jgi:hypothetical protein|nr:hypothetical protein [Sphingomonadales bacterium]